MTLSRFTDGATEALQAFRSQGARVCSSGRRRRCNPSVKPQDEA